MASTLLIHLAQNLAVLEQAEYTDPKTGKRRKLKDSGAVWLKVLNVICCTAGDTDRQYYAGWRYLAEKAGTNQELATEKVAIFVQLGWLAVRPPRRLEAGKKGKPANCWEVTLPALAPLDLPLWSAPEAPPAKVQDITTAKRSRRRSSTGADAPTIGALLAAGAATAPVAQPEAVTLAPVVPAYGKEALQAAQQAENVLLVRINSELSHLSDSQKLQLLTQHKGIWQERRRSKQVGVWHTAPLQEVQQALASGGCTDTQAVTYLASDEARRMTLQEYLQREQPFQDN
jgi:hypothetical protein